MAKVEAAKTAGGNMLSAGAEDSRESREHDENDEIRTAYQNDDDNDNKKVDEISGHISKAVDADEIRKNHSRIMAKVEAAKTAGGNMLSAGAADGRESRQHDENGESSEITESSPDYKKYNDIYKEPIDIYDEFLSKHDRMADGANGAAIEDFTENLTKTDAAAAFKVSEEPSSNPPLNIEDDMDSPDTAPEAAAKPPPKVRFPIAVKLLALIMLFLVLSLGAITSLVSILVSADVKLTAEDNNFSINRRTADALQTKLHGVSAAVTMLLYDFETLKTNVSQNDFERIEGSEVRFFFEQNPQIAAVVLNDNYFINENFFRDNGGESGMPHVWMLSAGDDINAASAGTVLLRNATPFFGIPMLVMCITLENYSVIVFINSETFNLLLDEGDNISYLLNENGDVLFHADIDMLRGGVNFSSIPFVKNILDNSNSSMQNVYRDENGDEYFAAVQRLNIGSAVFITLIRASVVFSGIMETTIRNIIFSIFVLAASTIFIILFSRTISVPLRSLTKAAAKIEDGDYDLQLKAAGNDELGILTRNFTGMGNSLENFEKFTNKAIVRLAKGGKLSSSGVNKRAAVCFAMIRDFDEVSDGLDAASVVDFVNDYLRLMVPCITGNGGCVDKFLTQGGVVIMALWGTPETAGSPKKDALNCVKAALSMRAALRTLNQKRLRKFGSHIPLVKLGCGINTGELIAGQIGSGERMEYTVIGDTVNLAARIEGPNDLFDTDILISEETYNYVSAYLITKEMRGIEVKGKEKPLRVFSVINIRDPALAASTLDSLQKISGIDIDVCKKCIGPGGPRTVEEVRESWRVSHQ
jgi:adenylate cyclase